MGQYNNTSSQQESGKRYSWLNLPFAMLLLLSVFSVTVQAADPAKDPSFDHDTTGFILSGKHQRLACDACHTRGIFKGIPKTCAGCHAPGSPISTDKKPQSHIPSSNQCGDCHLETTWLNARVDHSSVSGTCSSCHNGTSATGKAANSSGVYHSSARMTTL